MPEIIKLVLAVLDKLDKPHLSPPRPHLHRILEVDKVRVRNVELVLHLLLCREAETEMLPGGPDVEIICAAQHQL